jgi:hypothetical protein
MQTLRALEAPGNARTQTLRALEAMISDMSTVDGDESLKASGITLIGGQPFARDPDGRLATRTATAFPRHDALVTLPGIHVTQRQAFLDHLAARRRAAKLPPISRHDADAEWQEAVDLIVEPDLIHIRPDPDNMPLAFLADEMMQRLLPKHRIRFLGVLNARVRDAIRQRGELWRITPLPKTPDEMRDMIESARVGIGGREIYYYSTVTGVKYLTCQKMEEIGRLDDEALRDQLEEILTYLNRRNAGGYPELAFFPPGAGIARHERRRITPRNMAPAEARRAWAVLSERFTLSVKPELRRDDANNVEWRNRMVACLVGREDELAGEETLFGLSPEFFLQVEWLPGGRIEDGEIVFDPALDQAVKDEAPEARRLRDEKPRKLIFNFVREYGDLEHINVGRLIGSLSRRPVMSGRRDVYIAMFKQRQDPDEILTIIRLQKRGVREFLDEGFGLLEAMVHAEEYTEYILDRRLGCRQLGMNLPVRVTARRLSELYTRGEGGSFPIWTPYFERDYIRGTATDKLPMRRFESTEFASRTARLLGAAAASNLIVGRCDARGVPLFDDGDEVLMSDEQGMPMDLVVSDHTGAFNDYASPLSEFTPKYAAPVQRRAGFLSDPKGFAEDYLGALEGRFRHMQEDYRRRRRAFDSLFDHLTGQEQGSFAYRWKRVLARLDETDPRDLVELIRGNLGR